MLILLPIDGSDESLRAAHFIASLPFRDRTKVLISTALPEVPKHLVGTDEEEAYVNEDHARAVEAISKAKAILAGHIPEIEQAISRTHPKKFILEFAEAQGVDAIVLGARGHSAIHRAVLGSTADYVVNHAKCTVVVVRPPVQRDAAGTSRHLLLAYDGSPGSMHARDELCQLEWPATTSVHAVTLFERPSLLPENEVYDPQSLEVAEADLADLPGLNELSCQVQREVAECQNIGARLCAIATREQSDVVFLGGSGKSAISRFFLGSIAHHVLHHAHCTIWLSREKSW